MENQNVEEKVITGRRLIWAKVSPFATIPTKRREDVGYDIYTCEKQPIVIEPNRTRLIDTGLAVGCSQDYFPKAFDKGGYGSVGITVTAGVGDSGYRDKYFISMANLNDNKTLVITNQSEQEIFEANYFDKKDNLFKYSEGIEVLRNAFNLLDKEDIEARTDINPDIVLKEDCIIKRLEKAITQFVMLPSIEMEDEEMTYEELLEYKSERGLGKCGSSGK